MPRRIHEIIPRDEVVILPPSTTVKAAAAAMKEHRQCVVLVMTGGRLDGILTEQDVVRRVAAGRDPNTVTLAEVMTPHPDTIASADLALKGLQMMEDGCYRHLPVLDNGHVIGLISRVDFLGAEKTELEAERHYWETLG